MQVTGICLEVDSAVLSASGICLLCAFCPNWKAFSDAPLPAFDHFKGTHAEMTDNPQTSFRRLVLVTAQEVTAQEFLKHKHTQSAPE